MDAEETESWRQGIPRRKKEIKRSPNEGRRGNKEEALSKIKGKFGEKQCS